MKKMMKLFACTAMTMLVLTSCGKAQPETPAAEPPAAEPAEPAHVHVNEGWNWDLKGHVQLCHCGESFGEGAHTIGDAMICTECGVEVWDYGDGSGSLYTYDENGEFKSIEEYDTDGNVVYEMHRDTEYDADGNKLRYKEYQDGVLVEEMEYAEGGVPKLRTNYYEDGTQNVGEYDENGNEVHQYEYDADGRVIHEIHTEYVLGEDGWYWENKVENRWEDGSVWLEEYNEHGNQVQWLIYTPDGAVETFWNSEYSYDENGNILWRKTDFGDRVDENTYTYDEDGNMLTESTVSTDGTAYYCEYQVVDGWSIWLYTKETFEDGSYLVREYDENEELVSEILYDVNGNEIPLEVEAKG